MFSPKENEYIAIQEIKSSSTPFFVVSALSQPKGIGEGVLIEYYFVGAADVSQYDRVYQFTPKPDDKTAEDKEFFSTLLQSLVEDAAGAALKITAKDLVVISVADADLIAASLAFPAITDQLASIRKRCRYLKLIDALHFPATFSELVNVQPLKIEVQR